MIGLIVVAAVLVAGPFFQGLFFPRQQHWAEAAVALGFLIWAALGYMRHKHLDLVSGWRRDPALWGWVGLAVLYPLHQLWAIYPHGNIVVGLQYLTALFVFLLSRSAVKGNPKLTAWLTVALVASAIGVCLVGLVYYAGFLNQAEGMLEAIALISGDARLMSTFELHNALAGFLLLVIGALVGLGVQYSDTRRLGAYVVLPAAAGVSYLFLLCLLLTLSRGGLLVLPLLVMLLIIMMPPGRRLPAAALLLAAGAAATIVFAPFMEAVDGHFLRRGFYWLITGGVAAVVLAGLGAALLRLPRRLVVTVSVAALVLPAALAAVAWRQAGGLATLVPQRAARLLDFNLQTINARIRLDHYMGDALRMISDSPWLGGGGRAFERLYFQYQQFGYFSAEVHNHYLQTWVELGLAGLLALLGITSALAWHWWLLRRAQAERGLGALVAGLAAGGLALLAHSVIDFDLSYLSILLWLAAVSGALAGLAAPANSAAKRPLLPLSVSGTAALLTLVLALPMAAAEEVQRRGEEAAKLGDIAAAQAAYARAARLSPTHPRPHFAAARLAPNNDEAVAHYQAAIQRDRYDPYLHAGLAERLRERRQWPAAATAGMQALALQPYNAAHYEAAMVAQTQAAIESFLAGDAAAGRGHVEQALQVAARLEQTRQRSEPLKGMWPNSQPRPGREYYFRYGQALALTGDYAAALEHLRPATEVSSTQIEAEIWAYLVLEQLGRVDEGTHLQQRLWIRALHINPLSQILHLSTK